MENREGGRGMKRRRVGSCMEGENRSWRAGGQSVYLGRNGRWTRPSERLPGGERPGPVRMEILQTKTKMKEYQPGSLITSSR